LPTILAELKARGYKIVHVVPATPDRPATVAENDVWMQGHHTRPSWPRVLAVGNMTQPPSLDAPSPANFGVTDSTGEVVALDLAPAEPRQRTAAHASPPVRSAPWPSNVSYSVPAPTEQLPSPAAEDFIYNFRKSTSSFAAAPKPKGARANLVATAKVKPGPSRILGVPKDPAAAARTRPVGHQLTVTKPTASASDVLRLGLQ
jgi:hypothetical protein